MFGLWFLLVDGTSTLLKLHFIWRLLMPLFSECLSHYRIFLFEFYFWKWLSYFPPAFSVCKVVYKWVTVTSYIKFNLTT
jgi:hypothetical protein